ncbi:ribonuclease P protein component 1 [Salinirubellus sp. GCM10025818]|jgi:ribonuclease P protein subunit POP4|uniref:ribonuclease P protein component 1 n=1 Tax=Salinirubellus TaxID=2162630 RepID=UPI0030CF9876
MLAPETLVRHELAGLSVRVVDAAHEGYVGVEGRVVDETANTLLVEDDSGVMQVQKAGATFEFALDDCETGDVSYAVVEGERLVARPARRTELTGDSKWR